MTAGKRRARDVTDPEGLVDPVDAHVARWLTQVPDLDPLVEGATTRLVYVVQSIRSREARAFAGSEFTFEDMHTLHALMVQPYPVQATPAKLAEECNVTRATMTSRLDRLVDGGYVTREVDPLDRRRLIVRPTATGRATWDEHLHAGMEREGDSLSALTRDELVTLNHLLRKVLLSLED